jgi:long-chain acyl-CoA synthetase
MIAGMNSNATKLSIPAFFESSVARRGDEPALGLITDGQLRWRTWREIWQDAQALAAVLRTAGIEPNDRVAQVSENRYEWIIADLAMHLAGAVHVPIHVSLSGPQIAEQIADCGARIVIVSSIELLAKFRNLLSPQVAVRMHDEQADGKEDTLQDKPAVAPDDSATILYTSGTTGRPRGVMLSQRNLAANAQAIVEAYGGDSDEVRLNVLPLSHIYARTCDLNTWVYRGSRLVLGESRETIARDLQVVRPTTLSAVPYVYERIANSLSASGDLDQTAFLKNFFGGRMKRLTCGGAALPPTVETWYAERGLPIHCGYGLTEASPVITVSMRNTYRPGSVGKPLANVEMRLAEDGEILVRAPSVMLGYWQDSAATAEAIRDGWLYTGDLGEVDADGFLTIVGRKSEMIVLSTGKNVSPSRVEVMLTASPLIEQAAVFGEGRKSLVALIVPTTRGEDRGTRSEEIAAEVRRCLETAAHEEQVRDFVFVERPFSLERGELTVKQSLCREVIAVNFAAELAILGEERAGHDRHDGPSTSAEIAKMPPLNASQPHR